MNKAVAMEESTLTSSQKIIFDQITALIDARVTSLLQSYNIEDYMISLTGAAGTGKTFLTTQIAKYLKKKSSWEYRFTVTAPTHKAVSVIAQMLRENKITASCKTIHSFLGIKPFIDYERGIETFKIDKTQNLQFYENEQCSFFIGPFNTEKEFNIDKFIKETIKKANNDGLYGNELINIKIYKDGYTAILFTKYCVYIQGNLIYSKEI